MKPLAYAFRKEWYNILLLLLPFLVIPFVWSHLPDQIPTHWNFRGEVDGYSSKGVGLTLLPLVNIVVYVILLYIHKIDPKKYLAPAQKPMPMLRTITVLLLFCLQGWVIAAGMGENLLSTNWLYLIITIFLILIGNYMRSIQPNYFIGIRLPWTLEDEHNWRRTHRVGSYLWVGGGIILLLLFPFFDDATYATLFGCIVALMVLVPSAYSFYLYKSKP